MKTRTAVLYEHNKPLIIEELEIPDLKQGQILVKIMYTGICRSQINEMKGLKGADKYLPHTLGHEATGIVEDVGTNVKKVKKGDTVVLSWIKGSGIDVPSTEYRNSKGIIVNAGAVTTFGEYSVVSENRVTQISDEMPMDKATLLGCAIPTGGGIILNQIKPLPGSSIAIVGVGGVGSSAILLSDMMDCNPIIAVDIDDAKLKFALEIGATHTINANKKDFVSSILNITDEKGVDYAVEAAGSKETIEKAFDAIKWDGGLLVIGGNPPHGEKICIDPFDLKGKDITGSWGGLTNPNIDIPRYANLYLAGKLKLDKLITDRFKFDEINHAFELLDKGKILGRAVLEFIRDE